MYTNSHFLFVRVHAPYVDKREYLRQPLLALKCFTP
jgi:hypothetical protein